MAITLDSPLVKTILLILAAALLVWVLARRCNWRGERFEEELEPVTFRESYIPEAYADDEDELVDAFEDDMEEEFEDDEEEAFFDEDEELD